MGVVPEPQGRWSAIFPSTSVAAGEARSWLQAILDSLRGGVDGGAAVLLLSELVTNAIRYSRSSDVKVDVELLSDKLVVGVSDDEPTAPRSQRPESDEIGGRGLLLVDCLAADWGVSRQPGGKRVWFNLKRTTP